MSGKLLNCEPPVHKFNLSKTTTQIRKRFKILRIKNSWKLSVVRANFKIEICILVSKCRLLALSEVHRYNPQDITKTLS